MDADKKLAEWAIQNKKKLGLKISELMWGQELRPRVFSFRVSIGSTYGMGSCRNRTVAFCKALSEALERTIVSEGQAPNSNGLAAHTNATQAQRNAKKELIERDAFFYVYFNQYPVKEITPWVRLHEPTYWSAFLEKRMEASFFHCATSHNYEIVFGVMKSSDFKDGLCITLACEDTSSEASKKACLELLYKANFMRKSDAIDLETFYSLQSPTMEDHFRLGLDRSYAIKFNSWLESQKSDSKNQIPRLGRFRFQELKLKNVHLQDAPVHIYKASNDSLQKPFWGHPAPKTLNKNRFPSGLLNQLPHPFA